MIEDWFSMHEYNRREQIESDRLKLHCLLFTVIHLFNDKPNKIHMETNSKNIFIDCFNITENLF